MPASAFLSPATASAPADSAGLAIATLRIGDVLFDGKPLAPGTVRYEEIRGSMGHFAEQLRQTRIFSEVVTTDSTSVSTGQNTVGFQLSFSEKEDRQVGSNVLKACLVGALTLGLAPTSSSYGFRSTMSVNVRRWDGITRSYSASSDASGSSTGYDTGRTAHASGVSARLRTTMANIHELIRQISVDRETYVIPNPH